ncbi:phage portal protein, partial [Bifidobacterium breve]|nr:phage portal protein [Bifidobacterium breve]
MADLMKRPSPLPGMTRYRFISTLLRDMLLDDRWLMLLGVNGGHFTLRRIPSDCYQLSGNAFGEITGVNLLTMDSQQAMYFDLPDPRVHLDVGFISGLQYG